MRPRKKPPTEGTISRRIQFLGYGACALAGCLWGTGFYFGRVAMNEMSVEHMVLYRFLFACLGMLPVALMNRVSFTRAEVRLLLISAFFGVPVQFLMQFHGLDRTTVSHASLMVGSMPVLLAAAAAIFAGERLDWIGWLALVASTIGAALIVLGGHRGPAAHGQPTLAGDLLVVASLCTALSWILLSKKLMLTHSPPVVTAYTIMAGTVMLAVWILGTWAVKPWLPNNSAAPAVSTYERDGVDRIGDQWPGVHRNHHAAVELGNPSRACFARRSVSEYRARTRFVSRSQTSGRASRPVCMVRRGAHSWSSHHPHHSRP